MLCFNISLYLFRTVFLPWLLGSDITCLLEVSWNVKCAMYYMLRWKQFMLVQHYIQSCVLCGLVIQGKWPRIHSNTAQCDDKAYVFIDFCKLLIWSTYVCKYDDFVLIKIYESKTTINRRYIHAHVCVHTRQLLECGAAQGPFQPAKITFKDFFLSAP